MLPIRETCLLELMPLPSPSTSHWLYGEHSDIPELVSREEYLQVIGERRCQEIARLIRAHQPKFVLFYGIGYLDWWEKAVGQQLAETTVHKKSAYFGRLGETAIGVAQHPVATGVTLEYFHEVGRQLHAGLDKTAQLYGVIPIA